MGGFAKLFIFLLQYPGKALSNTLDILVPSQFIEVISLPQNDRLADEHNAFAPIVNADSRGGGRGGGGGISNSCQDTSVFLNWIDLTWGAKI